MSANRKLDAIGIPLAAAMRRLGIPVPYVGFTVGKLPYPTIARAESSRLPDGWKHIIMLDESIVDAPVGYLKSVIAHELLHAAFPGEGHEGRWLSAAEYLNSHVIGFKVTATYAPPPTGKATRKNENQKKER